MRKRKWSNEQLFAAAKQVTSTRQLLSLLGLKEAGGNYKQIAKYLEYYKVDTSHFRGKGWNRGLTGFSKPRLALKDILVSNSNFQSYKLKQRLFNLGMKERRCEMCGWAKKSADGRMPLELDHINGNNHDNRIENLRVLCPNCHSLQPTHRGRNMKKQGSVAEW